MSDERSERRRTAADASRLSASDDTVAASPSGKRTSGRARGAAATIESPGTREAEKTAKVAGKGEKGIAKGESAPEGSPRKRIPAAKDKSKAKGKGAKPKNPAGNPIQRVGRFLREVIAELKKVIWPNKNEMVTYTIVVLVFIVFIVALIAGLDIGFAKGISWLFG